MAVLTAGQLIQTLQDHYDPTATLVVTWWDKSDVADDVADAFYEDNIDEPTDEQIQTVWTNIADELDNALDSQIGWVNDTLFDLVQSELGGN